jgi:hypothetical protein
VPAAMQQFRLLFKHFYFSQAVFYGLNVMRIRLIHDDTQRRVSRLQCAPPN